MSTETIGLLGTGVQDVHLDFHTAHELWCEDKGSCTYKSNKKWGGVRVFERFTGTLGLSLFHIVTTLSLIYA